MSRNGSKRTSEFEDAYVSPETVPYETLCRVKEYLENEIDQFMINVGCRNPANYTDDDGWRTIKKGSAVGYAGIYIKENSVVLDVRAIVMPLPSDKNLIVPLMRELLEINANIPYECRFGISNDYVIAGIIKSITNLEEDLIPYCISTVMGTADEFDDYFISKYGGTTKPRK